MSASNSASLPIIDTSGDFIGALLQEQQSLTAVERFSREHDMAVDDRSGAPAQEIYYRQLMPATGPGPNQQYAFEVDLDVCSGCKACVVACHTLNGLEEHETWRRVGTLVGEATVQHVTTACHHCADPGCLKGCPVQAYVKDPATGIVLHLDDQCIGCKYCTMMCPYEVPQYSDRLGIVRKCDMCHQRLAVGEAPACVQSCPNEAIRIRVVDSSAEDAEPSSSSMSRLAPGAPDSSITRPTTTYLSKRPRVIEVSIPQDAAVDPVGESHWPLAVMLVGTQGAIGLVIVERLAAWGFAIEGESLPSAATRFCATLALVMAGLALTIAPLHLGQPLKAWRVFLGLKTSWLSREAVILGGFAGVLTAAVALLWLPSVSHRIADEIEGRVPAGAAEALLGISIPIGVAGLYSSAMIYVVTRRRFWRFQRTMPRFAGSALCIGTLGFALAVSVTVGGTAWVVATSMIALAAIAAKITFESATHYEQGKSERLGGVRWGGDRLGTMEMIGNEEVRSARIAMGPLRGWVKVRGATVVISMPLIAAAAMVGVEIETMGGTAEGAASLVPTICLAVALAASTVGEIAERLLYFASVVYDRMPGTLR